ncbi:hypothetical protein HNQ39_004237 [Armatimonas rosea]|uniref:Uncharacterized protein n=1 Tax=Armatimonas rosea TaxID=685828 RepID=A0A7W9STJ9_ARMRO|nr:hypothetical protein [Armatimonas rosea]
MRAVRVAGWVLRYDIEHLCFYVFTDTSWDEIRADADAFVSILGGEENPKTVTLIPWPKYAWFPSDEADALRGIE